LDAAHRVSTRNELIKQQSEIGITTIYVTHDQVEAMTMGHRICIMDKGEVIQVGQPLQVYGEPANMFVARFLGNPPMNLMPAKLEVANERVRCHFAGTSFELTRWSLTALGPALASGVILGMRPEDLYELPQPTGLGPMAEVAVRVIAVEPLGAETLLVLASPGGTEEFIARVGRQTRVKPGDRTAIALDTARLHLFDAATTKAIPQRRP
jgi:multiple sugar transport system ATP-binding protein